MKLCVFLIIYLNYYVRSYEIVDNFERFESYLEHEETKDDISLDWWQNSVIYQIYPRSFKDSNGDGIGDLNGIKEKFYHLYDLGVTATWLSPIFKSPMVDFGYDISNYQEIQPEYGTMNDFIELLKTAKKFGIKLILDFVPNHTSDEHEWFIKSVNKDEEFKDFYVWHPGYPDPTNPNKRIPPSNWISFFWGSAWEWNEKRQEFYLHQFHKKQPDLNYRNPKVVDTMKSVMKFWLDQGVDGFRIDAVPALFEIKPDESGRYKDEPKSGYTNNTEDPGYLLHIYTQNQDETLDMVYQWRNLVDEYQRKHGGDTRVLLTEAYTDISILMKYYGDGKQNGSHIPFNFYLITNVDSNSNAKQVKESIDLWMNNMPKQRTANWVIGNHDQKRLSERYGKERLSGMAMLELTLPGAGIIYYGEEIGMSDVWISWNDTVDPAACNTNPSVYERYSRDPERTPMQWDHTISSGFSTNQKTWLPVANDYRTVNVKYESECESSLLKIYQNLISLRKRDTFKYGQMIIEVLNDNVIVNYRFLDDHESYITVFNWGSTRKMVDLHEISKKIPEVMIFQIVGLHSKYKIGEETPVSFLLEPYESFILRSII